MRSTSIQHSSDPILERRRLMRPPYSSPKPALFLDRDGVLIEDQHHICDPDNILLCPGGKTLLNKAMQEAWPVVLITNQSGISRGYFNWQDYERITDRLLELLGSTAPLAAIYANGYGPNAPAHSWRKPSPGMLLAAAKELNLDLHNSILIGDRLSDIEAGARSNLRYVVHILSGHGKRERSYVKSRIDQKKRFTGESHQPKLLLLDSLDNFPHSLLHLPAKFSP